jgi:AraC-like DNA-binding protein
MNQVFKAEIKDILALMGKSIQQGMSVEKLLTELNLPSDLLADNSGLINFSDCWRIVIANQNTIQDETHLMSSRPLKKGTTRLIFSNLHHSRTLFEALSSIAETYNIVHGGDYNFVRKRGDTLSYIVDDRYFHYTDEPIDFAIEFALIRIHCALSILAAKPLRLLRVCTKRTTLPSHNHHLLIFNSKIVSAHNVYELTYDMKHPDNAFCPSEDRNITGYIYDRYLRLLSQNKFKGFDEAFVATVSAVMLEHSWKSVLPNQGLIAAQLNMSVATLRRKLSFFNLNYRGVLNKVYGELSINLIQDGLPIAEVAERLGYSDLRSFKRAFYRWHNRTPAAYKASLQFH